MFLSFIFPALAGLIKMLGGLSAVALCSNVFLFVLNLPLFAPAVFILPLPNWPSDVKALIIPQAQVPWEQQGGG